MAGTLVPNRIYYVVDDNTAGGLVPAANGGTGLNPANADPGDIIVVNDDSTGYNFAPSNFDNERRVLTGGARQLNDGALRIAPAAGDIQLDVNNSYILSSVEVAQRFEITTTATSPATFTLTHLATPIQAGGQLVQENPTNVAAPLPVTFGNEVLDRNPNTGDINAITIPFTRVNARESVFVDALYVPRYTVVMPRNPSAGDIVTLKKIGDAHPIIKGESSQSDDNARVLIANNSGTGTLQELRIEDNEEVHLTFLGTTQGWWLSRNEVVRFVDGTGAHPLNIELSSPIEGDLVWVQPANGVEVGGIPEGLARFNGTSWISANDRIILNGASRTFNDGAFRISPQAGNIQLASNNSYILSSIEVEERFEITGTDTSPQVFSFSHWASPNNSSLVVNENPTNVTPAPVTFGNETGIATSGHTTGVSVPFTRNNANSVFVDVLYVPRYVVIMPQSPVAGDTLTLKKTGDAHPIIKGHPNQSNASPTVHIANTTSTGSNVELIIADNEEVHLTYLSDAQGWWLSRNEIIRYVDGTAANPLNIRLSSPIEGDFIWVGEQFTDGGETFAVGMYRFTGTTWQGVTGSGGGGAGIEAVNQAAAGVTMNVNELYYILPTINGQEFGLPGTPDPGDSVWIVNRSGTTGQPGNIHNRISAPAGVRIHGDTGDLILDNPEASFRIVFFSATVGWLIVAQA